MCSHKDACVYATFSPAVEPLTPTEIACCLLSRIYFVYIQTHTHTHTRLRLGAQSFEFANIFSHRRCAQQSNFRQLNCGSASALEIISFVIIFYNSINN